ncbi:MAG TPA: pseudouridine synthase [Candidatus Cloacimonadota bacterium]|nr:pseudouridine synthase [Candidatus Cloacimonadota bacterium]
MHSSKTSLTPSSKTASNAGEMRLNRYLALHGYSSRRKAEELIKAGRVSLNGEICTELATKVDPATDKVSVDGMEIKSSGEKLYLILNKPKGYVVTHSDEMQRPTIFDLLPPEAKGMNYAGRLDKNSEGLLLLTNDGELINRLTHPSFKVEKVYKAVITPPINKKSIQMLRQGVPIQAGTTAPAGVFVKEQKEGSMVLKIVIYEGRKRQIRQMIEAVGSKVMNLKRLQFGPITLKNLPLGHWRPLTPGEIRSLKSISEVRSLDEATNPVAGSSRYKRSLHKTTANTRTPSATASARTVKNKDNK